VTIHESLPVNYKTNLSGLPISNDHPHELHGWCCWISRLVVALILFTVLHQLSIPTAHAQYSIDWHTIDGGGGTGAGGAYTISSTIGQPDASNQTDGGVFSITGGFWALDDASAPGRPVLLMQRSNNAFIVAWPLNSSGFCLETTFNLAPPVVWQLVTSGITTNGATLILQVTNTAAVAKQFFRLANPCSSPSPVALAFQVSNNVSSVTWPVAGAFRLQTTFNLAPPISWQGVSNGIATVGANKVFTFTNNPTVTNQFFRLVFP
jgi:hypothetical protein